jgi:hypothetical protein
MMRAAGIALYSFLITPFGAFAQFNGGNGHGEGTGSFASPPPVAIYAGGSSRGEVAVSCTPPYVLVSASAYLEIPLVLAQYMRDDLRAAGLVPLAEPYAALGYTHVFGGHETTTAGVLAVSTASNAIVDWVVLELRDASAPATILSTRSALLKRAGGIVATDGVSPVHFNVAPGSYYVAVRHRNHLGVMTQAAVPLSTTASGPDFRATATQVYGTNARKLVGAAQELWAGDADFNGTVKYTGSSNDRDPVLVSVGSATPNNVVSAVYSGRDLNMDGSILYTGTNNDRDIILVNVGSTTPNNVLQHQLP